MERRESGGVVKIFYCYAHEDQLLRDELEKHLTPLKRAGKIVTWCDRDLLPGTEWESKVSKELNAADLILLLVSPDFICSDYCYGDEMQRAYERHSLKEAWVIPIILRPVLWKGTIISKFHLLPAEGKPVTQWDDRDEVFAHIAQGIDQVVETLLAQKIRGAAGQEPEQPDQLFVPQPPPPLVPLHDTTLLHKRYIIQHVLGRGDIGVTYLAKDIKRNNNSCAIKEMSLSAIPAAEQEQAIRNFKTETKILWSLDHPNVLSIRGFFMENQRYFMVMEYIDGLTLEDLLEHNRGPFPESRVLGWAWQLCDALEYLHSQQPPVIFRDIKPNNIMLTSDDHIKLIDFGIARFFHTKGPQDTQILGTPGYAPPEQYGKSQTDERSDIYSLAITISQLLTDVLASGFGLKNIRATNPHISPRVASALEKAASFDPEDRYDCIASFRKALLA